MTEAGNIHLIDINNIIFIVELAPKEAAKARGEELLLSLPVVGKIENGSQGFTFYEILSNSMWVRAVNMMEYHFHD